MALQKTFNHNSGATATYWRIVEFSINYANNTGRIALGGYVDAQARLDGNAPLMSKNFGIGEAEITTYFSELAMAGDANNLSQGYLMIKEQQLPNPLYNPEDATSTEPEFISGEFADALDV